MSRAVSVRRGDVKRSPTSISSKNLLTSPCLHVRLHEARTRFRSFSPANLRLEASTHQHFIALVFDGTFQVGDACSIVSVFLAQDLDLCVQRVAEKRRSNEPDP